MGVSTEDETMYLDILRLQSNYGTRVDHKESIKGTTLFTPMKRNTAKWAHKKFK